jgi:hypothetical protein
VLRFTLQRLFEIFLALINIQQVMLQLCSETHVDLMYIVRYFCSTLSKNGIYCDMSTHC